jgi:hypothetical protein
VSLYHDWFVNLSIGETASFTLVLTFGAKDFFMSQSRVLDGNQATNYLESAEHVTQQNVSDQLSMDKI